MPGGGGLDVRRVLCLVASWLVVSRFNRPFSFFCYVLCCSCFFRSLFFFISVVVVVVVVVGEDRHKDYWFVNRLINCPE